MRLCCAWWKQPGRVHALYSWDICLHFLCWVPGVVPFHTWLISHEYNACTLGRPGCFHQAQHSCTVYFYFAIQLMIPRTKKFIIEYKLHTDESEWASSNAATSRLPKSGWAYAHPAHPLLPSLCIWAEHQLMIPKTNNFIIEYTLMNSSCLV